MMKELKLKLVENLIPEEVMHITQIASWTAELVTVRKKGSYYVDAKSVLGIFSLGIKKEDVIIFASTETNILEKIEKHLLSVAIKSLNELELPELDLDDEIEECPNCGANALIESNLEAWKCWICGNCEAIYPSISHVEETK